MKLLCEWVVPLAKARPASTKRREEAEKAITTPAEEAAPEDAPPPSKPVRRGPWLCVELHAEELSAMSLRQLQEVLARHPGRQQVALVWGSNGQKRIVELGQQTRVEPEAELMTALRPVAGVGHIYEDDFLRA